jgi:site-specific DNA-methyltransferase (adenine-specific)
VIRIRTDGNKGGGANTYDDDAYVWDKPFAETTPATDAARQWAGWGTALKPSWEPVILARKPLAGTVAANVLAHGTGGLNVDGCRVGYASDDDKGKALAGDAFKRKDTSDKGWSRPWMADQDRVARMNAEAKQRAQAGRWPANVIHDGSDDVVGLFPMTGGGGKPKQQDRAPSEVSFTGAHRPEYTPYQDTATGGGSAARFYYCAKASKRDRDEGCEALPQKEVYSEASATPMCDQQPQTTRGNHHPTVKPTALMRYLCRLITPPGGIVMDPFMGSGSTGKAAIIEGFRFTGCELEAEYCEIARARITAAQLPLFTNPLQPPATML